MVRRLTSEERAAGEARERMQDENRELAQYNIPFNNMSDRQYDHYIANEIDRMCEND